jgi:hypothetical protein
MHEDIVVAQKQSLFPDLGAPSFALSEGESSTASIDSRRSFIALWQRIAWVLRTCGVLRGFFARGVPLPSEAASPALRLAQSNGRVVRENAS